MKPAGVVKWSTAMLNPHKKIFVSAHCGNLTDR